MRQRDSDSSEAASLVIVTNFTEIVWVNQMKESRPRLGLGDGPSPQVTSSSVGGWLLKKMKMATKINTSFIQQPFIMKRFLVSAKALNDNHCSHFRSSGRPINDGCSDGPCDHTEWWSIDDSEEAGNESPNLDPDILNRQS
jgi:hypothetical protein